MMDTTKLEENSKYQWLYIFTSVNVAFVIIIAVKSAVSLLEDVEFMRGKGLSPTKEKL